jgi:hypothetical protein
MFQLEILNNAKVLPFFFACLLEKSGLLKSASKYYLLINDFIL